jgi:predicted dehydrogenase
VLCEKPVALHAAEARRLIDARDRCGVAIAEAAMVRVHPRWLAARQAIRDGRIGELGAFLGTFAYNLPSRDNVRYDPAMGGGALLDVGFYPVTTARFVFGEEPLAVAATIDRDPQAGVDRLVGGMLRFPRGAVAAFTCGMQLHGYQRVDLVGTRGRLELEMAFTPPPDRPARLALENGARLEAPEIEVIPLEAVNQYTVLAEAFVRAAREGGPGPVPLEDSVQNMAVLDAIFRAAETGRWEAVVS